MEAQIGRVDELSPSLAARWVAPWFKSGTD